MVVSLLPSKTVVSLAVVIHFTSAVVQKDYHCTTGMEISTCGIRHPMRAIMRSGFKMLSQFELEFTFFFCFLL